MVKYVAKTEYANILTQGDDYNLDCMGFTYIFTGDDGNTYHLGVSDIHRYFSIHDVEVYSKNR